MQINPNPWLIGAGVLLVVETTGFGMGFVDLLVEPVLNWLDKLVEDKSTGFGLLLPVREVLLAHRKRRDFVRHYWPVLSGPKAAESEAEKLDRIGNTVPTGTYKSRERVYPLGDSEFYENRQPKSNLHVPDATRF